MDNETLATTSSPRGQLVSQNVLDELDGKAPDHFVTLEIDGKLGQGIYLTKDLQPTTKEKAELLKVMFEDGSASFFTVGTFGDDPKSPKKKTSGQHNTKGVKP